MFKPNKIFMVEDHHEAYHVWKNHGIAQLPLVHIDAHLDFHINHLSDMYDSYINIGNYVYSSIREKIVKEIYWIIPGKDDFTIQDLFSIKEALQNIKTFDSKTSNIQVKYTQQYIKTKIYGVDLTICKLHNLPIIKNPVLLDIDIDFFVNGSISKTRPYDSKKQWISIDNCIKKIKYSIISPSLTTISYSVNGGWTPLQFKVIGDELAYKFGLRDKNIEHRLLAGKCFLQFAKQLQIDKIKKAKQYYLNSIMLNPAYKKNLSEYGMIYIGQNMINKAQSIFYKLIKIDKFNTGLNYGLSIVYLKRNRYSLARKYLMKVLTLDKKNKYIYLYLAYIEIIKKNYSGAKDLLVKCIKIDNNYAFANLLLGYVNYILGNKLKSNKIFTDSFKNNMSFQIPVGMEKIHELLIC